MRYRKNAQVIATNGVDDRKWKAPHDVATPPIPLCAESRMFDQEVDGMLELREQCLLQSYASTVSVETGCLP
jgi:hypothetical protein